MPHRTLQPGQIIVIDGVYGRAEQFPKPHIVTIPLLIGGHLNPEARPDKLASAHPLSHGAAITLGGDRYYVTAHHDRKPSTLKLTPATGP